MSARSIHERLAELDWKQLEGSLWELGYAKTHPLLTANECENLIGLYGDDRRFRSRVDMERYRFGRGDYAYFAHPLPRVAHELRTHAYRHLVPIANRWQEALGREPSYPPNLQGFLDRCHASGQKRPTPLLLHYEAQGYNCLHQDLYGDLAFPLQITAVLSRAGVDYGGGEFLLLEQRPRAQSRGEAMSVAQGELMIFPCAERPAQGKRGMLRLNMRHGVSRIVWGSRYALGIIFHDAR
ncbi:MAG: prolyl 4-hydroxylase subunit alpha [Deltaproteobacteria bacterium]|nr:MAG: prolyl 4-hydroxylase subunit alpha [Deltaproteobacteria bacterium]TDJ04653.1 MAG: prolyl 4-hydroxylase subunit alpha [Deltaproteobacteria bacterium]